VSDLHTQPKVTAQPNHFTSLRGFLAALDQMNDLHEVRRKVDTDLEIGAIIRRTQETYAPAPLFTNIRGHAGYRVVGPAQSSPRPSRRSTPGRARFTT
jgi:UbiD family decarboxylase